MVSVRRSTARRSALRSRRRCTSSEAHMDGHGWGEAAKRRRLWDRHRHGAGPHLQRARLCRLERSIRFALWNNEETGLNGSRAYVEQRQSLQGQEDPPASGRYPEPRWLGMIQHDMMLFDHGAPRADGTVSRDQRPEADVNIEFQSESVMVAGSRELAWLHKASQRRVCDRLPDECRPTHDEHRLHPSWKSCPPSACERTCAVRRSGRAGTRTGISRPIASRHSATTTSASA